MPMPDSGRLFSRLLKREGKLLLRCLPSFLILLLLFGLMLTFGLGLTRSDSDESDTVIRIGIVLPEQSASDGLYVSLFTAAANFPHTLEFPLLTEQEAKQQIRTGTCTAAILFPENYRDGLLYGDELSLHILISAAAGTSQMLFSDLADAGLSLLINLEAGCYAAHTVSNAYGYGNAVSESGSEIAEYYVKALLQRLSLFEELTISDTGALSLSAFAVRTILLLLLFLSAVCYLPLFDWQTPAFQKKLRVQRFSPFWELLIPLLLLYLSSLLLSLVFLGSIALFARTEFAFAQILPELFFTPSALFGLLSALFACASLLLVVCQLIRNPVVLSFVQFFGALLLLFVSGAFLPSAYLPKMLTRIAAVLPAVPILRALSGLFTGVTSAAACISCLLLGLLLYLLSVGLMFRRSLSERSC